MTQKRAPEKTPDLTYQSFDGLWTKFFPETKAGEEAYDVMARECEGGVVAFLGPAVPGVVAQLRSAGYTVAKAKKQKPMSDEELLAGLGEIEELLAAGR